MGTENSLAGLTMMRVESFSIMPLTEAVEWGLSTPLAGLQMMRVESFSIMPLTEAVEWGLSTLGWSYNDAGRIILNHAID